MGQVWAHMVGTHIAVPKGRLWGVSRQIQQAVVHLVLQKGSCRVTRAGLLWGVAADAGHTETLYAQQPHGRTKQLAWSVLTFGWKRGSLRNKH